MQLDGKSRANPVQVDVSAGNWTHDDLWSLETDSTQGALLWVFHSFHEYVYLWPLTGALNL